ncbi:MAG: glycosyltransferase family 2 protein [Deltaproteobacteria bacterium]|nr:glycosyltransferase family 2 protein [Deltaproteobacteria bacterium]MBW2500474.1 glycosyltransferase family 2 protein [Deltaproteobacteria bacterium]
MTFPIEGRSSVMRSQELELSVVIPAFNEASRLSETLGAALDWLELDGRSFEVIVVDDGSSDGTGAVADAFASRGVRTIRLPCNSGKGAAVRCGIHASRGHRVLMSDADFSTPIEELEKLESRIGEAAVVIGSRAVADARILRHQPFYREILGKIFNRMLRLVGVRGLADTQCGFKLLDGAVARELFEQLVTPGFAFDVELVWLARRAGYRVVEVGIVWDNSADSRVNMLVDPARMIFEILRFRWHHRRHPRHDRPSSPS